MQEGIINVKSKAGYARVMITDAKVNQLKITNIIAMMIDAVITIFGLTTLL
jgi:hypothetical protein